MLCPGVKLGETGLCAGLGWCVGEGECCRPSTKDSGHNVHDQGDSITRDEAEELKQRDHSKNDAVNVGAGTGVFDVHLVSSE